MKKFLLTGAAAIIAIAGQAQKEIDVFQVDEMIAQKISSNGLYVCGQDVYGAGVLVVNSQNEAISYYEAMAPGNFNSVANNGLAVGQDLLTNNGAVMFNNKYYVPDALAGNFMSSLDAVTSDATKAVGYMGSNGATYAVPIIMELDENGQAGKLTKLPYPKKDFLGDAPQFVTACTISDDGNTIAGFVTDGSGFYSYPIVFKADEAGKWTTFTPSEPLFNPNNLPIPKFPESLPNETDQDFYAKLDQYWDEMAQVTANSNFALNQMRMSRDGSTLVCCLGYSNPDEGMTDEYSKLAMCIFDLNDMSYKIFESEYNGLTPIQVLADKSIVCFDTNSFTDYIIPAGYTEILTLEEYLKTTYPELVQWMRDNLGVVSVMTSSGYQEMIVAGILSFSEDMSTLAGGYSGLAGNFTYVVRGLNAGVETIVSENNEGKWVVFDLLGNKLLDTTNAEELNSLPKGIFIINGKKVLVK